MNHTKSIDGLLLRQLLVCGFDNLNEYIHYLNEINVFPVADGDTGNNMRKTYGTGVAELVVSPSFSDVFESFVQGMLIGSRGNSGSILSQYFLGIYEQLKGKDTVSVLAFCRALKNAYIVANQAVLQPVEGTMLTVMREGIENTSPLVSEDTSLEEFLEIFTGDLFVSVKNTTGRLPVLSLNNVVDSGAAGFYLIFCGIKNGLYKTDAREDIRALFPHKKTLVAKEPLTYRYCAEFLLKTRRTHAKEYFIDLLKTKGDSLIVTTSYDILKVHIHTNEPQRIIDELSKFGSFAETKIDDMLIQRKLNQFAPLQRKHDGYLIISFVHGDGMIRLFYDLGCDIVFTATQNYQISEENFHLFVDRFRDDQMILLPNDENIYQTARNLYPPSKFANIHIIHSQNVIKSYFLLSLMVGTDDIDTVLKTFSTHEKSDFFFVKVLSINIQKKRYFVGISESETVINTSLDGLLRILTSPQTISSFSTVVIFRGQTAKDEEALEICSFYHRYEDLDFDMLDGKQDDSDFIIGAM